MPRHTSSVIAVAAAIGFSATAASAADIAPAAYDWSGFYFGANAGAAWSHATVSNDFRNIECLPSAPACTPSQETANRLEDEIEGSDPTFTGGGLVGFNWQHDSLVIGVEADFNYVGFGDDADQGLEIPVPSDPPATLSYASNLEWSADWFGTVRGRVGFAADNLLLYVTGGLAYGDVEARGELSFTGGQTSSRSGSTDDFQWGWTAGAGAEFGLSENLSIGAEYLYVDLGSADFDYDQIIGNNTIFEGDAEVDYSFSVARATLKFRF
jgi:outer membrane immunogenic protein